METYANEQFDTFSDTFQHPAPAALVGEILWLAALMVNAIGGPHQ